MVQGKKLRVMLSSRCDTCFPDVDGKPLTEIRRELKSHLQQAFFFDMPLFEVWINEDEPAVPTDVTTLERCTREAREADIVIVLWNGSAGFIDTDAGIGICHAEAAAAMNHSPSKVVVIKLASDNHRNPPRQADTNFNDFMQRKRVFRKSASNERELRMAVETVLREAVVNLAIRGNVSARHGASDSGQALAWKVLDQVARADRMAATMRAYFKESPCATARGEDLFLQLESVPVLLRFHGLAESSSNASAREKVGKPFLQDRDLVQTIGQDEGGPFHIIACYRDVTRKQAEWYFSHDDVNMFELDCGILISDRVHHSQIALLRQCFDETTTTHRVQQFMDWLNINRERHGLDWRALARANVSRKLAEVREESTLASGASTTKETILSTMFAKRFQPN